MAALLTGYRYGDLVRATVENFNPDTHRLFVPEPKSGRPYYVPLSEEGRACFSAGKARGALIFRREDEQPWGASHQFRRMRAACAVASIDPPVSFHVLRHTYGSMLARQRLELQYIAEVLGHADSRITHRHYAHLQPGHVDRRIRESLPQLEAMPRKITPIR